MWCERVLNTIVQLCVCVFAWVSICACVQFQVTLYFIYVIGVEVKYMKVIAASITKEPLSTVHLI